MSLDLDTGRGLALALLPELILTAWALLILLYAAWRHGDSGAQRRAGWLSLAGLGTAAAAIVWLWIGDARVDGIPTAVAVDPFRWAASLIVIVGAAMTTMVSLDYLDREGISIPEYHAMVLFAVIGMLLLVGGADLLIVFLGLELMSVSVYVLAGINRRSKFSAEAALKYFLLGAFASAFFLYGIALVYGATGTTKLGIIAIQISGDDAMANLMLAAGLGLLFIGFAFKVGAVPFHMWVPDVYDGAPTPVTAFMAAAVKAAAFGAFVRLLLQALSHQHQQWDQVIWWLAAITMVVGNLVALAQRSLKRMLAYSSIAHAGYLLAALVSNSLAGAAAFLYYLLFYTLVTVGAFTVLIAKGRGGERDVTTDDLAGLSEADPLLALVMAASMLSLMGFPGTAGFIGKWYILTSAVGSGYPVLAAVLVLTSVLSAGYYLPVIMAMYMKPRVTGRSHEDVLLPAAVRRLLAAVVVAVLFFGVLPNGIAGYGRLLDAARSASHSFLPANLVPLAAQPTTEQ